MSPFEQLDLLPEAVLVLDPDHVVVHVNDRGRDLLQLDDSAVGRPVAETLVLLTPDGTRCADVVPSSTVAARIAERQWLLRLPDGRSRPVALSGRHLDDGGVTLTLRTAGRHAAVRTARMDLLAQVSHDLRAPIATIRGFTRPLLERWERLPEETRHTFVQAIDADAARIAELLDELVVVARLETGRLPIERETVDVPALVTDAVARARVRPAGRGRQLVVAVATPAPRPVAADPRRLEQIVTNLVDNALVHAPGARVDVSVRGAGDVVEVLVDDDGPGIPASLRDQVFQKFGRGRDSRRAGTGLGLYIARRLARAHGGDVVHEQLHPTGARFRLTLPAGPV